MIVQNYVDDIIFGSTDPSLSKDFEDLIQIQFEMSMTGKFNHFLGLNIHLSREGIFINKKICSCNLLKRFGMTNCSKTELPNALGTRLLSSLDKVVVDLKTYCSMIGSLLYLTVSWPDFMFSLCNCARYQMNPSEPHLTAVNNILNIFIELQLLDYGI